MVSPIDRRAGSGRDPDHQASRQAACAADAARPRQAARRSGVPGGAAGANASAARATAFASASMKRSRTAGSSSGISRRSISRANASSARKVLRGCSIRRKGLLPPSAFLDGASDQSLLALNEIALINALKAGHEFARLGLNLEIALNVTVNALRNLPVAQIIRTYRPHQSGWPGLIFDVLEEQIVEDPAFVLDMAKVLRGTGVRFAIDNFSGSLLSRTSLKTIPFAELKIKRNFIAKCDGSLDRSRDLPDADRSGARSRLSARSRSASSRKPRRAHCSGWDAISDKAICQPAAPDRAARGAVAQTPRTQPRGLKLEQRRLRFR